MGGKALQSQGYQPRRITSEEQKSLLAKFQTETKEILKISSPVLSTQDKKTHGDTDVSCLLLNQYTVEETIKLILRTFKPKAFLRNDNILSVEFHQTQFDLALHNKQSDHEAYLQFCHYSPLGNILGVILQECGCKYTLKGLFLPLRDKNNEVIHSVKLTQDMKKILGLAGLPPQPWLDGFQTKKSLHDYCIQSPLIDPSRFLEKNLNHKNRQRLRQRPDYQDWIETITAYPQKDTIKKSKEEWWEILQKTFPEAELSKNQEEALESKRKEEALKAKFNGKIFAEITGLNGIELGNAIKKFKIRIELNTPFPHWVQKTSTENIRKSISQFLPIINLP